MSTTEIDNKLHASVMKREAVKEREFRQQRAKYEEEFYSNLGMGGTEMSKQELKKIIDGDRRMYYRTEELNDKLYIHYKGWRDIKNLEGWTGLKALYAECNAFSYISGLQNCRSLRSLFLQENCIKKIEGLENCTQLFSINLASNFIERIEGLSQCRNLNSLNVSKNKIGHRGIEDLEHLVETTLNTIDIQDNRIEDPDILPEVLMRMPQLRVLYLKGNGCCKKIVNYRKSITVYCEDLRYLDDRPVFPDDRRAAEAFNRGGIEEERAERRRIKEEERTKHERNMKAFNEMIENSKREKRERLAMRAEDKYTDETDPVESYERRCKRLTEAWKAENANDLKDDAMERAERMLKAEREQEKKKAEKAGEGNEEVPATETNSAKASAELRSDAAATSAESVGNAEDSGDKPVKEDKRKLVYEDIWDDEPSGPAKVKATTSPEPSSENAEKVDNRKLVYDDIWDDVPPSSSSKAKTPAAAAPVQSPAPKPRAAEEAVSGGVFLPWATGEGAVGMDAIAPSAATMEQRKATLRASTAAAAPAPVAAAAPSGASAGDPVAETCVAPAPSSFGELDELD